MKKSVASITLLVMLFTVLLPFQAFAAYDKELEKAIGKAKTLFNIPKSYDNFEYSMNKYQDKTIFNLRWSDSKHQLGEISVNIDSDGKVNHYYFFEPYNGRRQKLPTVSKSDALKVAGEFIQKVDPSIAGKLKYVEENVPLNIDSEGYQLSYMRVEDGVPYPGNNVNIMVDGRTGEVRNYYSNWYEDIKFPKTEGAMSIGDAQQMYMDKLGLQLVYKMSVGADSQKPYLVYTSVYNNQYIDAITGEIVEGEGGYYGYYGAEKLVGMADGIHSYAGEAPVNLNPQEQQAVDNAAGIMDQNKAEETARNKLKISQEYKLVNISLYNNWQSKEDYMWSLEFNNDSKSGDRPFSGYSVSLDAKTGTVLSFYKFFPGDTDAATKYSREQALKIAETFVKNMQPAEFKESERTPWNEPVYEIMKGQQPRQYNFNFTRKTNGAYFLGNGFNLSVDGVTGEVVSYNYNWYKKELPPADKIITSDEAHEILFKEIGLEKQFTTLFKRKGDVRILPSPDERITPEIGFVYALKPGKPVNIDAATGKLINYDGKPFEEALIAQYTDIRGHYAENQIKVLAEYGISLPGKKLEPNKALTQKEFLYLLLKATNPYVSVGTPGDPDEDALYNSLMGSGIIKEGEKSPDSVVQRQDAVKFIVRALNYDKVAELDKKIFKLPFKDAAEIRNGLYGYMAVGYGLNIYSGSEGYSDPSRNLTRAQGLVMIYNFLNVN